MKTCMFGDIKYIKMLEKLKYWILQVYKCKDKIEINYTDKILVWAYGNIGLSVIWNLWILM
jgi:hypothetical protein